MMRNSLGTDKPGFSGRFAWPGAMRMAALVAAMAVQSTGAATAQDASWESRHLETHGRAENETCRKARAKAAEEARAHLGLNIKACACRQPNADGEDTIRCRLDFEVLVRK